MQVFRVENPWCVTLFATPGAEGLCWGVFLILFMFLMYYFLMWVFSLSFNALLAAYYTLELLLSYPEGISSFFWSSHLIQFSFWPCSLPEGYSFSLLTLKTFENSWWVTIFFYGSFHAITDDSGTSTAVYRAHFYTWIICIKFTLLSSTTSLCRSLL